MPPYLYDIMWREKLLEEPPSLDTEEEEFYDDEAEDYSFEDALDELYNE